MLFTLLCADKLAGSPAQGGQLRHGRRWWQEETGHPWAGGFDLALGIVLALVIILALGVILPLLLVQWHQLFPSLSCWTGIPMGLVLPSQHANWQEPPG